MSEEIRLWLPLDSVQRVFCKYPLLLSIHRPIMWEMTVCINPVNEVFYMRACLPDNRVTPTDFRYRIYVSRSLNNKKYDGFAKAYSYVETLKFSAGQRTVRVSLMSFRQQTVPRWRTSDWKASWTEASCSCPRHNQVTLTCRAQNNGDV